MKTWQARQYSAAAVPFHSSFRSGTGRQTEWRSKNGATVLIKEMTASRFRSAGEELLLVTRAVRRAVANLVLSLCSRIRSWVRPCVCQLRRRWCSWQWQSLRPSSTTRHSSTQYSREEVTESLPSDQLWHSLTSSPSSTWRLHPPTALVSTGNTFTVFWTTLLLIQSISNWHTQCIVFLLLLFFFFLDGASVGKNVRGCDCFLPTATHTNKAHVYCSPAS